MTTISFIGIRLVFKGQQAVITRETYAEGVIGPANTEHIETVPREAVEMAIEEAWKTVPRELRPGPSVFLTTHDLAKDTIEGALINESHEPQHAKIP